MTRYWARCLIESWSCVGSQTTWLVWPRLSKDRQAYRRSTSITLLAKFNRSAITVTTYESKACCSG